MPDRTIKIEGARFVLTMSPQRTIIQDGSIMVEGRRIAQVGKAGDLRHTAADRVIDARDMVVTPGFVNGHVHVGYAHAVRGIFPDNLGAGYLPAVFKLQGAMTEEEEYYTSLLAMTELLKYGTTCFLDPGTTQHLPACLEAYREAGCRTIIGWQVADQPNPLNIPVTNTDKALAALEDVICRYHGSLEGRVSAWAMPFSAEYSSRELLTGARALADKHHTGLTLHHHISPSQAARNLEQHGHTVTEHLEEMGVLGPNALLSHALGIGPAEVDSLARTGASVVMCPTAAVKSGAGTTRSGLLPEMLQRGITVGLGTDAGNNSNLLETLRSVYLAAVLYKDGRQDVGMVPAEAALELATIRGAEALGLADDIGSIEAGKKADLVLFDTRRPEWRALFNPVNNLVYNADGRSVHTVLVDGAIVVEDHIVQGVDEGPLLDKVQAMGERLLDRTGIAYPSRWPVV